MSIVTEAFHMEMCLICKTMDVREELISIWKIVHQDSFRFSCFRVDGENGTFRKRWRISIGFYPRERNPALHKAAMKYTRMPKSTCEAIVLFLLEINNVQQTYVNILSHFSDFVVSGNLNEKFNFVVCPNQILSFTLF